MRKIVLTGPESTGKTTLAKALSSTLEEPYATEKARSYLEKRKGKYGFEDLEIIARLQLKEEQKVFTTCTNYAILDTDLLTIKVWAEFGYQKSIPWINESISQNQDRLYLLCGTDVPWEPDPLREHPGLGDQLYSIYQKELLHYQLPSLEVEGPVSKRLDQVLEHIRSYL